MKFRFFKTIRISLREREKNTETDRFHGNGPYYKFPTKNQ